MAKAKDPFSAYLMPIGLTEGVQIALPGTPAVFKCILPGTMNEDFNMELISRMNTTPDADGNMSVDAVSFQRERKKLFFSVCILEATGLPKGMNHDEFFAAYPLAARAVYDRATELAIIADQEAQDCLGKFEPTPNGKSSGAGKLNSTMTSSQVGSRSRPSAPN